MSTQISQSVNTAAIPRNFAQIWDEALRRYKDETGKDLLDLPVANAFRSTPGSADEVMKRFDEQNQAFKAFRDHGQKLRGVLRSIVDVVLLIKDWAEDASVSSTAHTLVSVTLTHEQDAIPGGQVIFGAIGVLLQVGKAYELFFLSSC